MTKIVRFRKKEPTKPPADEWWAVLQKQPPEALEDDDDESRYGSVDVLMVGSAEDARAFLDSYKLRHAAACAEFKAWDDGSDEWDARFDAKFDELCDKYHVNCLVNDVRFEIVMIGF